MFSSHPFYMYLISVCLYIPQTPEITFFDIFPNVPYVIYTELFNFVCCSVPSNRNIISHFNPSPWVGSQEKSISRLSGTGSVCTSCLTSSQGKMMSLEPKIPEVGSILYKSPVSY